MLGGARLEKLDRAGTACKIENELDDCSPTETAQFAQTGGQSIAPGIFRAQPVELSVKRIEKDLLSGRSTAMTGTAD
jgi:hypothetical protein